MNAEGNSDSWLELIDILMTCEASLMELLLKHMETLRQKLQDEGQLANVDLQSWLQKQQQVLTIMSTISKMLHDTTMAVLRKLTS